MAVLFLEERKIIGKIKPEEPVAVMAFVSIKSNLHLQRVTSSLLPVLFSDSSRVSEIKIQSVLQTG